MDKVVLVTGGSRGIGKAVARKFLDIGYIVLTCSRTEPYFCDVRHYDHVKMLFDYIIKNYGRLDVLVTCAGILGPMERFEDSDIHTWKDAIDVNLMGTVNCIHQAIPLMKKQRYGRIITFAGGGVGGNKLPAGLSAYNTSKFAVAGFTESLGKELDFFDITINTVSPGAVDTDMARSRWAKGDTPDKVVELVTFLATTDKHINGKMISAVWDDYKNQDYTKESIYNLRRTA